MNPGSYLKLTPAEVLIKLSQSKSERPALECLYVPPETETQKIVADCWAESLGISNVGIQDNFFSVGGDSMHMTQIISQLRKYLNVELSFQDCFSNPTVAGIAKMLDQTLSDKSSALSDDASH